MSSDTEAIKYLHEIFAIQKAAFLKDQNPSLDTRIANISKIASMLMSNRQVIRDALTADFGSHPHGTSDIVECLGPAGRAAFVASQLPTWLADEPRYVDPALYGSCTAVVRREPKGVIGTLVPFNFPFDLSVGPLVEQLAGGNRVIIKPSEFTPECAKALKKMVNDTFDKDLVEVVIGGVELGREFSTLQWNHLLYTGSPAVGKLVMASCAKNLTPVTLELGGKCPAIFGPNSVTSDNVKSVIGTKLLKNGQMCVSVDYVLLPEADLEKFLGFSEEYIKSLGGFAKSEDCTGIISQRHFDRLVSLLDEAKSSGARIVSFDEPITVSATTRRMPLSFIVNPSSSLKVSTEEIFGPLLPIVTYKTLEDAVGRVNEDERPLGLYVFSEDDKTEKFVLDNTKSGGAAVNSCALQAALPSLGFGGVGQSGMGRHHGLEGFREFTNPKGVFVKGKTPDLTAAFFPPYSTALAVADHAFAEAAKAAA